MELWERYEACLYELACLRDLLEQDQKSLSGCLSGELLESYQKMTQLELEELDRICTLLRECLSE